ncbi:formyl transferase [Niabella drilacis]|uniref:phosphoribosylglycinamide formyltransferase 1 n=1 Tax=Niabella drilacis (strain DSM 25811 / CCM 8410 / CCUG 62505 / LMG 26954 / E90) TaxID=1285928 RepID=A0A1G6NT91_NIADE|nr:formyl transferase [Niabella drilacis]SDC70385.1 Formyl transferase [Niabella drilacis]
MKTKKIILLATACDSTTIIFNHLKDDYCIEKVIIEQKEGIRLFLKRRVKKLGVLKVAGQLGFMILLAKPIAFLSKKRIRNIIDDNGLSTQAIPEERIKQVISVNSNEVIAYLKAAAPDLVLLSGTRIVSKKVLTAVGCRFINIHAGITPKYRGVHGAYWALANQDPMHCGVTVHFVDPGIDTGDVLYQEQITPEKKDNFATYPYLQLVKGVGGLKRCITAYFEGTLMSQRTTGPSYLWYHPSFFQYLYSYFLKRIK